AADPEHAVTGLGQRNDQHARDRGGRDCLQELTAAVRVNALGPYGKEGLSLRRPIHCRDAVMRRVKLGGDVTELSTLVAKQTPALRSDPQNSVTIRHQIYDRTDRK